MMRGVLLLAFLALCTGAKISHVVVLMLENRSFDHMIGMNKKTNPSIDGCLSSDPRCTNPIDPTNSSSPMVPVGDKAIYVQPADPSHSVNSTTEQVFGLTTPFGPQSWPPSMSGFVHNYAKENSKAGGGGSFIMECFSPDHLPVMSKLVEEYAVFNTWHASVPGPTMVNRAYADSATSYGEGKNILSNEIKGYPQRTIYKDLADNKVDWRVYFELIPASMQFKDTREYLLTHYRLYLNETFHADVARGDLASYTFIDPRYDEFLNMPARDMHPDHDVGQGEWLIKEVYESLRNGPKWNETLLLVTYDEHGGFYDHVPPPRAPNPDGRNDTVDHFDFTRLGVRVPAIAISPWTQKGSVVGAPANPLKADGTTCEDPNAIEVCKSNVQYEHSSIVKSLHQLFTPDAAPLTQREIFAAPFHEVVTTLDEPRTDCPMTLPTPLEHRSITPLPEMGSNYVSELQHELATIAAGLSGAASIADVLALEDEDAAARFTAYHMNKAMGADVVPIPEHPTRDVPSVENRVPAKLSLA